jgi:hypothetical protein
MHAEGLLLSALSSMQCNSLVAFLAFSSVLCSVSLAEVESAPEAPKANEREAHKATPRQIGDRKLEEGALAEALAAYKEGWEKSKDKECLRGIAAVYMSLQDANGLGLYIGPIFEEAKSDLNFLKIALGYSLQTKDEKFFRRCLGIVDPKWFDEDENLRKGIARGALRFFSEKDDAEKKK